MKRAWLIPAIGVTAALAMPAVASANAEATPTFAKDVAPILYENCVVCHRAGEVAPMSLVSYKEVRPWSRAIREKVTTQEMPPWHADRRFGEFRNDRGLTEGEISTIVAWVDAGSPMGSEADLPPAPTFSEGWNHPSGAPPDYVRNQPIELELPAEGEIPGFDIYEPVPFTEDQFLEAIELRPGNRAVVHHMGAYVRDLPPGTELGAVVLWPGGMAVPGIPVPVSESAAADRRTLEDVEVEADVRAQRQEDVFRVGGTDKLVSYVPGRGFEQFWPGVGKRIRPGKYLAWNMHYNSTGKVERDLSEIGFWFQKGATHHEILTQRVGQTHLVEGTELVAEGGRPSIPVIPPHAGDWAITGITAFADDITLYAMSPHMHLRGKDATYVVTYPDGREEVILSVPKYDFNWQLHYELKEPKKIPAGSTIKSVGHFDNSVQNRYNPAPQKEVYWAEQSWDEMFNSFMEYSIDKLDLTKERPSTE
jgi:hypothetical protein